MSVFDQVPCCWFPTYTMGTNNMLFEIVITENFIVFQFVFKCENNCRKFHGAA
jgi:hypothetical protein